MGSSPTLGTQIYMKSLDLHGKSYEDAEQSALIFIENNIDNLPIEIITGNSVKMQNIIGEILKIKDLSGNYSSTHNLGSIVITEKR